MASVTGNGSSVNLPTGSGDITAISADARTVDTLDTSHLGTTTNRTFISGDLIDNGGFSVEGYWNGATPSLGGAGSSCTVTIKTSTGTVTQTGTAVITSFEYGISMDELTTFSASVKWLGAVTLSS